MMERVDRVLGHPEFQRRLTELTELERDRIFCRHGLDHLLAVARLMLILSREEGIDLPRDRLYAAALLHDVGRGEQYRTGVPHARAGVPIAEKILADCGFGPEEREELLRAIAAHSGGGDSAPLSRLLYRADKLSRPCFACPAAGECSWTHKEKNLTLEY